MTDWPDDVSLNQVRPVDQLPPDVKLIGREAEMELLQTTLSSYHGERRATIASIIGEPGVGKSALAIHFAHALKDRFPDSQLYADLQRYVQPHQPVEPAQVIRRFLLALGAKSDDIPEGTDELIDRFQDATEGKRLVIVLDNAVSYEQVRSLIPRSPTCHVIVTSQPRFAKLGVMPLILEPLSLDSAVALFHDVAPSRRASTADEEANLLKVLTVCDGLPLAIRVLGARLGHRPSYSFKWILESLDREKGLSSAFGPGREEITASFRVSYKELTPPLAKLFRRLGAVPGSSFERNLAAELAEVQAHEAGILLEQLNDLQLLQQTADPNYFTMHSLLRQFAIEQLTEDHDPRSRLEVFETALNFYLRKASVADQALQSEFGAAHLREDAADWTELVDQDRALTWFTAEHLNLVATVKQASIDGYWEMAWRLCSTMIGFFEIRSEWESWRDTHESTMAILNSQEQNVGRAHVLRGMGRLSRALRRWDEAIEHYREAVALFRRHDQAKQVGTTLHALGDVYRYERNWDAAANCLEEARAILQETGYARGVAIVKRSLGTIPRVRGDFETAITLYREAIAILEAEGDERWAAATTLSLADIYLDRRFPNAQPLLERCLAVFERYGDRHWQALTLRSLGEALRLNGHRDEALERLTASLESMRQAGDRLWEAQVLHSIGLVHLDDGRPVEALNAFHEALAQFKAHRDTLWEGRTYVSIGRATYAISPDDPAGGALDAYYRAWPLLIEQGAKADLEGLRHLLSQQSR
jgi:tetratricopeptide (TPR) repeat protein